MRFELPVAVGAILAALCISGCSSDAGGPKIVAADGVVTYKGSPLAGATVTFVPEKGPLAMGVTDLEGKFKLSTGALVGVAVGSAKVSVTAYPAGQSSSSPASSLGAPPQNPQEAAEYWKKVGEMQQSMAQKKTTEPEQPRSLIPERYAKAETSGLSYTVNPSGENHFTVELKD